MGRRFEVSLSPHAERDLDDIKDPDASRIETALESLQATPWPSGVIKLQEDTYRIRVGDYRVIYFIDDKERVIIVTHIRRRTETTYRHL